MRHPKIFDILDAQHQGKSPLAPVANPAPIAPPIPQNPGLPQRGPVAKPKVRYKVEVLWQPKGDQDRRAS